MSPHSADARERAARRRPVNGRLTARPAATVSESFRDRPTAGFTLIEVLVALTLGALVVLLAHRVFAAVVDGAGRLTEARTALDREANARRWLTLAVGSITVASVADGSFGGHAGTATFGTWLPTARGGFTIDRVNLARTNGRFVAQTGSAGTVVLADSVSDLAFDYLLDPGANATWVREWISPVSAPLAVRVRIQRGRGKGDEGSGDGTRVDTLLFIIGPRG